MPPPARSRLPGSISTDIETRGGQWLQYQREEEGGFSSSSMSSWYKDGID